MNGTLMAAQRAAQAVRCSRGVLRLIDLPAEELLFGLEPPERTQFP